MKRRAQYGASRRVTSIIMRVLTCVPNKSPLHFCFYLHRRFAWGRSRLPLSADQFHQAFKIQAFARTPADAYLPVAHTCFFSLELPRYSSREVG